MDDRVGVLKCRHFFSGAAVYRDGDIIASLTPVGLAFKVSNDIRTKLLNNGRAIPLRYFPNSPVKKNYVLFTDAEIEPGDAVDLILDDNPTG